MSSILDSFEAHSLRWRHRVLDGDWAHSCFDWDELPIDEHDDEITSCSCLVHPVEKRDNRSVTFVGKQDYGPHHAIACTCGQILAIPVEMFLGQGETFTELQQADIRAFKEDHTGGNHVLTYTMVDVTPIGIEKLSRLKD